MIIKHPNGISMLVMNADCQFMADVYLVGAKWVTFGCVGGEQALIIDESEWDGFVAMVKEVDEARRQ